MQQRAHILDRLVRLRSAINTEETDGRDAGPRQILLNLMNETEALVEEWETAVEPGGSEMHPLGKAPFLTTHILYNLDACEELLHDIEKGHAGMEGREELVDDLVYPSFWCSIVRSFASLLLSVRGCFAGYAARYEYPTFREVLYIRSGLWLEPFLRRMLVTRKKRTNHDNAT